MNEKRFVGSSAGIYDHYKDERYLWSEWEIITDKMNALDTKARERSKALSKLQKERNKENALKEANFTKMGGFILDRDDRGCYNIYSENVSPKNSPVIEIKSPNVIWNQLVVDILSYILTENGE